MNKRMMVLMTISNVLASKSNFWILNFTLTMDVVVGEWYEEAGESVAEAQVLVRIVDETMKKGVLRAQEITKKVKNVSPILGYNIAKEDVEEGKVIAQTATETMKKVEPQKSTMNATSPHWVKQKNFFL